MNVQLSYCFPMNGVRAGAVCGKASVYGEVSPVRTLVTEGL